MFSLVVDDFGIQYTNLPDAQHLLAALKQHYEAITVNWTRSLFCSISLKWDYRQRVVDLSMPGYINSTLEKFGHQNPTNQSTNRIVTTCPTLVPKCNSPNWSITPNLWTKQKSYCSNRLQENSYIIHELSTLP
jgi:hypothetical protein